jgi:hypothetical protein
MKKPGNALVPLKEALPPAPLNYPHPPAHLQPYVKVLGVQGAVEFFLTLGGAEIYLTNNPKSRSRLVEMIGPDKLAALAQEIPFLKVRVPTAKPWIACCLRAEGQTVAEIARTLHTADNAIRRWSRNYGTSSWDGTFNDKDPRQLSLF